MSIKLILTEQRCAYLKALQAPSPEHELRRAGKAIMETPLLRHICRIYTEKKKKEFYSFVQTVTVSRPTSK